MFYYFNNKQTDQENFPTQPFEETKRSPLAYALAKRTKAKTLQISALHVTQTEHYRQWSLGVTLALWDCIRPVLSERILFSEDFHEDVIRCNGAGVRITHPISL